ncbi:peptidase M15-like protein [Neorhizobium alkalisoli]|uniref:Peptidase M15-like protein n=2 Tax=Neorhizobium alkalisoli TaxID=528178 RepID=A0A561QV99_9HYPH|nr:peptidase M15-like protein [Neorhizobium alkalisoli]
MSSSFGGCQILGSNHDICGYPSAAAMFQAFNTSERWEICAFFDFCKSNNAIDELKNHQWEDFASIYNGSANAKHYGKIIGENYDVASELLSKVGQQQVPVNAMAAGPSEESRFAAFVINLGLKNFKPYELLTMGHQHSNPNSPAFGLNTLPPEALWPNIVPTIRVLDNLRDLLNAPIVIQSVYRSPAYNTAIGGEANSQHMEFRAIDFIAKSLSSPADWAAVLRQMRANGAFAGGIGTYPTFVHVDTRGHNADW